MKVGIKIYSRNIHYVKKIIQFVDFIELLPEPNCKITAFKRYAKPFVIHAPHFAFNVNLADSRLKDYNLRCIRKTLNVANALDAKKVIVHPGMINNRSCKLENSLKVLNEINDKRIIIENLPLSLGKGKRGKFLCATPKELKAFCKKAGLGVCFDFGHACAAASTKREDYKKFVKEFLKLEIKHFHLSDSFANKNMDYHLSLGKGNLDMEYFKSLIPKTAMVTLETPQSLIEQKKEIKFLKE